MIKIVSNTNCGNSPKMAFLQAFKIAFVKSDLAYISENISQDFVWTITGEQNIEGKENVIKALEKTQAKATSELIFDQILTHGKEGATNGVIKMKNGKNYAFSDFYKFQSAKGTILKSLTSYVVEI